MKLMIISPHPDDETLGAGGTLLKYAKEGHSLYWINVTNMKPEYGYDPSVVDKRQKEIGRVKTLYGIKEFFDLGLPPTKVDEYPLGELIKKFKAIFEKVEPEILIIPYRHDVHSDHRIVYDAVSSCIKAFRAPYVKTVLSMEILSETDQASYENFFSPNVFIDITNYIESKICIMHEYKSEVKEAPFPRNEEAIRGLASIRGATSGYKYAEAFCLIRNKID